MAVEGMSDEKKYFGNKDGIASNQRKRRCLGGLIGGSSCQMVSSASTFERNIGIRVPHYDLEEAN